MSAEYVVFKQFTTERKKDLLRISRHTQREHQLSDVETEAWLLSIKLRETRDIAIDFSNREYQNLLLSHLYQHLVRYTERNVRYAVRLDHAPRNDNQQEDAPHPLTYMLASDNNQDPLTALIEREAALPQDMELDRHQSLAGAYVRLLRHFDNKMPDVANHLLISTSYSYKCCADARILAAHQQSIPLMSAVIDSEFLPRAWRRFKLQRIPSQLEFDFSEKPFLWSEHADRAR
jgi:hypothetical protein